MKKNILLIANPCSGKGRVRNNIGKIVELFSRSDCIINLAFTTAHGDAQELVKNLASSADVVVCIGGDGTVNEVVNGMLKNGIKKPIGYIPMGTTNDFAKSMGISKNLKKCVNRIIVGNVKPIDICKFNDEYFVYVASFGIFAKSSSTDQQGLKNKIGYWAYILLGSKEIWNAPQIAVEMRCQEKIIKGKYVFGAICNSKSIGGIIKLKDEETQMNDGKFEIVLIKYPTGLFDLIKTAKAIRRHDWNNENLLFCSVDSVDINNIETDYWSLDGEKLVIKEKGIKIGVNKKAIEVIV